MKFYHEASKIVKPKLEALAVAEGQMDAANKVGALSDSIKVRGWQEKDTACRGERSAKVNNSHRRVGDAMHAGDP